MYADLNGDGVNYHRLESFKSYYNNAFLKICNLSKIGQACLCGPKTKTASFARSWYKLRTITGSCTDF